MNVTLSGNASYTFNMQYSDAAANGVDSTYALTLDNCAPTGKLKIDDGNVWENILTALTFGIWRKSDVTVPASMNDVTSMISRVRYIKQDLTANGNALLDENDVKDLLDNGGSDVITVDVENAPLANWINDNILTVSSEERFILYAEVTER